MSHEVRCTGLTGHSQANFIYSKTNQCKLCQHLMLQWELLLQDLLSINVLWIWLLGSLWKGMFAIVFQILYASVTLNALILRQNTERVHLVPLTSPSGQTNSTKAFTVWTIAYKVLQSTFNSFPQLQTFLLMPNVFCVTCYVVKLHQSKLVILITESRHIFPHSTQFLCLFNQFIWNRKGGLLFESGPVGELHYPEAFAKEAAPSDDVAGWDVSVDRGDSKKPEPRFSISVSLRSCRC